MGDALVPLLADGRVDAQGRPGYCLLPGLGPPVAGRPSAQRLVWAAKQPLGNAALGALFA